MCLTNSLPTRGFFAVAALGLVLSGQALATPQDDIVIVSPSVRQIGPRAQDQVVSLTRHVSFADLDLSTSSGAKQLEVRVHEAANALCIELERKSALSPNFTERFTCVNGAVANGMEHARAVIAAAEKRTRTAGLTTSSAAPR